MSTQQIKTIFYKDQTQSSFHSFSMLSSITSAETAYPSEAPGVIPLLCKVHAVQSFVFCVVFDRSSCLFFLRLFCCLSVFNLRLLITPLISSTECLCLVIWIKRDHNVFIVHVKLKLLSISFRLAESRLNTQSQIDIAQTSNNCLLNSSVVVIFQRVT